MVVRKNEYKKTIGRISAYGFTPKMTATMLLHKFNSSPNKSRPRVTMEAVYAGYVFASKENARYNEHVDMQTVADRLEYIYVVNLGDPRKEDEAMARFNKEYRDDKTRGVPVIVILGRRKLKNDSILKEIKAEAKYRFQHPYMSTAYRGYAKKHGYLPFKDFLKFI